MVHDLPEKYSTWSASAESEEKNDIRNFIDSESDNFTEILTQDPANVTQLPGPQLRAAIEALLLIVDLPVTESELADVLLASPVLIHEILFTWQQELYETASGMQLRFVEGGWRLYTHPDYANYVERFILKGARTRLSRAALETLAVVAYRQPVSRQEVASVRGVNVDSIMRTLQSRGLVTTVKEINDENGPHVPQRYCTTAEFLERLGLNDLTQLPSLASFLPDRSTLEELAQGLDPA